MNNKYKIINNNNNLYLINIKMLILNNNNKYKIYNKIYNNNNNNLQIYNNNKINKLEYCYNIEIKVNYKLHNCKINYSNNKK